MIDARAVEKMIASHLPEAKVTVADPMNDGTHLQAEVVCASFEGKSLIERHRMVYAALGSAFAGPLHALQLSTKTPTEAAQ